jgi:hypothetical protein
MCDKLQGRIFSLIFVIVRLSPILDGNEEVCDVSDKKHGMINFKNRNVANKLTDMLLV